MDFIPNSSTNLFYIIGKPVKHSKSPYIHNTFFRLYNINSIYLAFEIENKDILRDFINGIKKVENIKGFNVTIPYKVDIIPLIDEIDEIAKEIGSVNTIKRESNGLLKGYNTDWLGVFKTLENNNICKTGKTLIIGAGGATNAVIYSLKQYGITDISLTNRTKENGLLLSRKFNINFIDYDSYRELLNNFDFIINATSISFNQLVNGFNQITKYFDLKYYLENEEKFVINGEVMLIEQALQAFKIWTNIYPDFKILSLD